MVRRFKGRPQSWTATNFKYLHFAGLGVYFDFSEMNAVCTAGRQTRFPFAVCCDALCAERGAGLLPSDAFAACR